MKKCLRTMFSLAIASGLTLAVMSSADARPATAGATIKGKVTLDGEAPKDAKLKIDPNHKDAGHCAKGDTQDLTWVTGEGNGLAEVVVFLKPAPGKKFNVDLGQKTWTDQVVIDQPFCRFNPHVSAMFAEYGGKPVQKLLIKNSAPILHNSRVAGGALKNPARGETLASGKEKEFSVKADTEAIKINCDAHKWMDAYVWAFDHPYFAVTDANGNYEIKNVPTDIEVSVMAWHEVGTAKPGEEKKPKGLLKDGDTINFPIKKK
ncbi:MAG: hypothetical protein ACJ8C4_11630 [Gemmataceae bacterium]